MSSYTLLLVLCLTLSFNVNYSAEISNSGYRIFQKIYDTCTTREDLLKCFKIQALKVIDRALHTKNLNLIEGISLVSTDRTSRKFDVPLNETKLEKLDDQQVNGLLMDTTSRFLNTHKIEINFPKLIEEGRKKKDDTKQHALMWALAIKGSFLAMAYKGIAVMAGTALIVGKMALLLSAILGLKKLVNSGKEKTTFEIVKHPKYSDAHTHSGSYEDDGYRRRSLGTATGEEFVVTTPYRGYYAK